jgi:transcriptional regulator with XRE-family HTH domain
MGNALAVATQRRGSDYMPARTGYVSRVKEQPTGYWIGSFAGITTLVSHLGQRACLWPEGSGRKTTVLVDNSVSAASDSAFWQRFDYGLNAAPLSPFPAADIVILSESGYSRFESPGTSSTARFFISASGVSGTTYLVSIPENPDTRTDLGVHAVAGTIKLADEPYYPSYDFCAPVLTYYSASLANCVVETEADLLTRVRAHLSLNTTELARALGVERATIYGWMKGRNAPRTDHHQRLKTLAHLAQTWTELCHEPVADLKRALIDGDSTLIDLLSEPELDEQRIKQALVILSERWKIDVKSRAAKRGKSIHEIARERGWEAVDPEIREQSIRGLSLGPGG